MPKKVEEKIRYLCRKFPTLEWSGVLFTTYEGNFEDNNLVITCQDIYPMDLGSPGFTQFKMDETVARYIADNIELFNADVQLIHSHNQMSAFFSGQDQSTLREEGNDRNCFVSLIVNNAGTYCAAVTRKIQRKKEVIIKDLGSSYQFFGEGEWTLDPANGQTVEKTVEDTIIEYFMLNVEVEKTDNPLAYLDTRFDEIESKKKAERAVTTTNGYTTRVYDPKKGDTVLLPKAGNDYDDDKDFYDWIHSERKKSAEAKEAVLFDKDTMNELVDSSKWQPDPTIIHYLVCQLVTCSLIVNKDIDLKQWVVKHMEKKYDEIFLGGNSYEFDNWSDSYVEFILQHYSDENAPEELYEDYDAYQAKIAEALYDELGTYPSNQYILGYQNILARYMMSEITN